MDALPKAQQLSPNWPTLSDVPNFVSQRFSVIERVGTGAFGSVFKGVDRETGQVVALKVLRATTHPQRSFNEASIYDELGGQCFVQGILGGFRQQNNFVLVLPFFQHESFKKYFVSMTVPDIKIYFHSLFTALAYIHSKGIIHRDVKPSNFLVNWKARKFSLIDFGLSQRIADRKSKVQAPLALSCATQFPQTVKDYREDEIVGPSAPLEVLRKAGMAIDSRPSQSGNRAGTRGFRAPEILLRVEYQTSAVDVWSSGVILLCILSQHYPFFDSSDDLRCFLELERVLGAQRLHTAAKALGKSVHFNHCTTPEPLGKLCARLRTTNSFPLPDVLIDLLSRCLDPNPRTRFTAKDALNHPFFADVKS